MENKRNAQYDPNRCDYQACYTQECIYLGRHTQSSQMRRTIHFELFYAIKEKKRDINVCSIFLFLLERSLFCMEIPFKLRGSTSFTSDTKMLRLT